MQLRKVFHSLATAIVKEFKNLCDKSPIIFKILTKTLWTLTNQNAVFEVFALRSSSFSMLPFLFSFQHNTSANESEIDDLSEPFGAEGEGGVGCFRS